MKQFYPMAMGCGFGLVFALTLSTSNASRAFGLAGEHPIDRPVSAPTGWPKGLKKLLESQPRVYGYFVNANDFYFYAGDAKGLNKFLKKYAALAETPLVVKLSPGAGSTDTLVKKTKIACDWQVSSLRRGWHPAAPTLPGRPKDDPGYVVEITVWLGGGVKLDALEVPDNISVVADGGGSKEIEKFIAARKSRSGGR